MLKLALYNIAIFQGLVIGLILLRSSFFKSRTNQYLAFALFALSWSLLNLVLDITNTFERYPGLKIVDVLDSALLFPVLIWFFVLHQVSQPEKRKTHMTWMFFPVLLSLAHSALEELYPGPQTVDNTGLLQTAIDVFGLIVFLITLLFIPVVLTKTFLVIRSSKNKQERTWLTYLWLFEAVVLTSWLMTILLGLFIESAGWEVMHFIALFATLPIHWVAYFGVYKLKLVNDQEKVRALLLNRSTPITITPENYASGVQETEAVNPPLTESRKPDKPSEENSHYRKLERLCRDQKIYRDSTLDRNKVAEMLGISPSYISQLVNSITGENFSTYINRYRVEEAKSLILDKQFANYSLLSIGLECGFSSKTTYYNWFKKITGITPNAFRKIHK